MTQHEEPALSARSAPVGELVRRIRPGRRIEGLSAVLMPFAGGGLDFPCFERLVARTAAAGLVPAVNMDTGYAERGLRGALTLRRWIRFGRRDDPLVGLQLTHSGRFSWPRAQGRTPAPHRPSPPRARSRGRARRRWPRGARNVEVIVV